MDTEKTNLSFDEQEVEIDEKAARRARQRARQLERRRKRNARIARCRTLKNFVIWVLGVIFLPVAIAAASFVIPIGTFTGNNGEVVSEDLSKKSLFEAARYVAGNYNELGFSDFPIIGKTFDDLLETDIGDGTKFGDIIYIDTDRLNAITFGSGDFFGDVRSCIEVVATIESVGGREMLGDFGDLSVFYQEEVAGTVAEVSENGEDAETKLQYYYKPSEIGTSSFAAANGDYKRAFKDNGELVDALKNLSAADKDVVNLYYPPLEKVKISELVDIFGESFGRITVSSLLGVFGIEHTEENPNIIIKILGEDRTIKGLGDFDINEVQLNVVLKEDAETQKLWDVLKAATGKDSAGNDPVVIGDLTSFDINSVKLNVVLDEKEEPDASDYATTEEYQAAYGDYESNKKLWDVLKAATDSDSDITLGDLANDFDMNNVRLNVVLDEKTEGEDGYETNKKLWDVLKAATGKDAFDSEPLTLGDLADDFDLDKVPLNNVIKEITDNTDPEYDNNHKFWTILKQAVILEDGETIDDEHPVTVGHLSKGFEIENVKLTDVIAVNGDSNKNVKLWTILEQTVTDNDGNPLSRDEITLHDLNYNFTVDSISLTSVLDVPTADNGYKNQQIYDILLDATGESDYDSIKLNSLSSFTANNIHLNTVLENVDLSGNRVLTALTAKDITVGDIGDALNDLSLYEVYGNSAFVEITPDNPAPVGARRFTRGIYHDSVLDVDKLCYDYDVAGNYYVDNTAGIWLILCFDTAVYNPDSSVTRFSDTDGNPTKYIADTLTVGDLQDGTSFSVKFQNATLKQLIDTNLVDGSALGGGSLSTKTQALSLQDVMQILARPDVQLIINNMA